MIKKRKKANPNSGSCDGCGKCIDACLKSGPSRGAGVEKISGIRLIKSGSRHMPVICRNCENAPCVTACMSGCRSKNDKGMVVTDYTRCIGCWMCIMACPFGAIERAENQGLAVKCDGCADQEVPPCAAACKRGILESRNIQQHAGIVRRQAAVRFLAEKEEEFQLK